MSDPRKAFFVWLARHKSEADALRDVPPDVLSRLWVDAWQDGAWRSLHDTSQLAGLVEKLEELIGLYRTAAIDRELEQVSVYWNSDEQEVELPF